MHRFVARTVLPLLLALAAGIAVVTFWQTDPRVGRLWLNTAGLAAGACLIALPLGTFIALAVYKTDAPGRSAAGILFISMLFTPLYVVTGAWDAGFGIQGWYTLAGTSSAGHTPWLQGWRAAIWVHGLSAVPWVVLIVGAAVRAVEAEIEEDAATCMAMPRVLWHVTLPRSLSSLLLAGLWIAIVVVAEISVTDFFQVRSFAEEVYTQAALGAFDPATGERGAISAAGIGVGLIFLMGLAVLAIAIARRLFSEGIDSPHRAPWTCRLAKLRWPAAILLWATVLFVAGLPLWNLLNKAGMRVSFENGAPLRSWSALKVAERLASAPTEFGSDVWLSLRVGAAAATAGLVISVPLAWSMRRPPRTPWLRLTLLSLALIVPGPLLGIVVIWLLNQPNESPVAFLSWLYDTNFAPWLVQTIRVLPMATMVMWPALASVPQATLDAAATEGSGSLGRLLWIAIPQRWPAVIAAWLIGLAIALGEVAATILVVPPQPSTMISVRVFQLLHYGVDDRMAAISLLIIGAVAALTLAATALLSRQIKSATPTRNESGQSFGQLRPN